MGMGRAKPEPGGFSRLATRPFLKFISNRSGPFDSIVLDRRRVYILPTKTGVLFAILLLILLIGSINYGKSLGFMLTFLLAGIGNVAMFATWRNLAGLELRAGGATAVFAGQPVRFAVQLENSDASSRYSIAIAYAGVEYEVIDAPPNAIALLHFDVSTTRRGVQKAGKFRIYTTCPMGLFISWTSIELNMSALVYPSPAEKAEHDAVHALTDGSNAYNRAGLEEFSGLRTYQQGDSWRRISWKASAKSDLLYTKEFVGGKPEQIWIDWNDIVASDIEQRLSVMARLVIGAESDADHYGLRLPGVEINPDCGDAHYHQCLRALAMYGN
jgi:uncharacterized protein (DUF58 family)